MTISQIPLPAPSLVDHETSQQSGPVGGRFVLSRPCGLSALEAGNLTARLTGLRAHPGGWTVREIEHLLFLRVIHESGRLAN